jgi:hypothetical protein
LYKIDSQGATNDNHFTQGDPSQGIPATVVNSGWLNAVQDEQEAILTAAGITADKNNSAQVLASILTLIGNRAGSRNLLINGDFRFAQRRKTAALSVAGGAVSGIVLDRWLSAADTGSGTGVATVSRQAHTVGQSAVPGGPVYFMRHAQTTPSSAGAPSDVQRIEGVSGLSGCDVTVSIWLKAAGAMTVSARATQNFGTGGSPSSPVVAGTTALSITTSWALYTVTFTLPGIGGKTLGTAGNDYLEIAFLGPQGATYTLDYSRAQFEYGDQDSNFEVRPLAQELALCRRYFEKSYESETDPATATTVAQKRWYNWGNNGGDYADAETRFNVEKRGTPSISWYRPDTGAVGSIVVSAAGHTVSSTTGTSRQATGSPQGTSEVAGVGQAHWAADAEL